MIAKYLSGVAVLVALSLKAVSPLQAQVFLSTQRSDDVATIVSQSAERFFKSAPKAVGLSIGVLKDGKTYTYNYGTIEKGKNRPPSADTLYQIASITKTFTGTILAQAVIEKKGKFEDDVRKYLDGDYPNLEFKGHFIQLGQLVNHNSGLPFNLPDIPENHESMCMTFPELHMAVVVLANEDDSESSHALSVMANEIAKTLDVRSAPLL